jgi:hypothetical protein
MRAALPSSPKEEPLHNLSPEDINANPVQVTLFVLKRLITGFPQWWPAFTPQQHVVDKAALERVFSEYFSFSHQSSFH